MRCAMRRSLTSAWFASSVLLILCGCAATPPPVQKTKQGLAVPTWLANSSDRAAGSAITIPLTNDKQEAAPEQPVCASCICGSEVFQACCISQQPRCDCQQTSF